MEKMIFCGKPMEDLVEDIRKFHGHIAPGLVIGGFMVDWALELLGDIPKIGAIVETCRCLPDAIQVFTPCTYGNGRMKILDWDKFAFSLYDKKDLKGFRVWLDLEKARAFPNIYNWYMRLVPKKDLPLEILLKTIMEAQRLILSSCRVHIIAFYDEKKRGLIRVCPSCGEAYLAEHGNSCLSCQGKGYYT